MGTEAEKEGYLKENLRRQAEELGNPPSPVDYAIGELLSLAVVRLPELSPKEVAKALRYAAKGVERGFAQRPVCEHAWKQEDAEYGVGNTGDGRIYWMERCELCSAIRCCEQPASQADQVEGDNNS